MAIVSKENSNISIIICTKDRAESLKLTLESIGHLEVPTGFLVELLVVDNGSTDQTEQVVRAASIGQIPARYICEPMIGKSHAYNTGLAASTGEIMLWTDDDVRVPARWIEPMCRPILDGRADAVAGGVIFPPHIERLLNAGPLKSRRALFASVEELDPDNPGRMVGANMAFHRRILDKVRAFDVELGPGPGALGSGEETDFAIRFQQAGYRLIGMFDAPVEHHFDTARLTREKVLDAMQVAGRLHGYFFHHWEHKRSRLVVPRLMLCHLRRMWLKYLDGNKGQTLNDLSEQQLRLEEELGFYREYIAQRQRAFKLDLAPHLKAAGA
jgi:glycosyltransferase involved in cell wall biosynthesis